MRKIKYLLIISNLLLFVILYFSQSEKNNDLRNSELNELTEINSITEIIINKNNNNIIFSKDNYDWKIKSPLEWRLDYFAISKFLNTFSHLKFIEYANLSEIKERGEKLIDYGINSNSTSISVKRLNSTSKFILGSDCRDAETVFCKLEINNVPTDQLWRISKEIVELSDTDISSWANMDLINSNFYQIDKLSVQFKSENKLTTKTTLQKKQNEWNFSFPFVAQTNSDEVRTLLGNLLNEKIIKIDNNETFKNKLNLKDNWKSKLIVETGDRNQTFLLSETVEQGNQRFCFCLSNYSSNLLKIESSFLNNLSDWSTKLREKRIFQFQYIDINQIKINRNDENLILKKDENDWKLKEGTLPDSIADPDMIKQLIKKLNSLEVIEFLSFNPTQNQLNTSEFENNSESIQIKFNDTSTITILCNNKFEDATLRKIFVPELSILCLIDESFNEILSYKNYEFLNKKYFPDEYSIKTLRILNKNNEEVIFDKNHTFNSKLFLNSKIKAYLNRKSENDGTWHKGDWVPWKHIVEFDFAYPENINPDRLMLSEQLGATLWLASFKDNNLTFNLDIDLIENLQSILNKSDP